MCWFLKLKKLSIFLLILLSIPSSTNGPANDFPFTWWSWAFFAALSVCLFAVVIVASTFCGCKGPRALLCDQPPLSTPKSHLHPVWLNTEQNHLVPCNSYDIRKWFWRFCQMCPGVVWGMPCASPRWMHRVCPTKHRAVPACWVDPMDFTHSGTNLPLLISGFGYGGRKHLGSVCAYRL